MSKLLVPIVEGDGDAKAVPLLLRRILHEHLQAYDWEVGTPKRAHSLPTLRRKLANYLRYARLEGASAVLILLDLDDGCPAQEARNLAAQVGYHTMPVAIVLAHREYEAWFLASIEAIVSQGKYHFTEAFTQNPTPPRDQEGRSIVEEIRDAKGWLTKRMRRGYAYKETQHQPGMTRYIDLGVAARRSRSFRRLIHAMEELVASAGQEGRVTPMEERTK